MRKKTSWKNKIDPAFDKFINFYLEILEAVKLPANEGYIHIDTEDPHFRLIESEKFPDFKDCYERLNYSKGKSFLKLLLGGVVGGEKPLNDTQKLFDNFNDIMIALSQNQIDVADKILIGLIESLPQKSKEFYMHSFVFDPIEKMKIVERDITERKEIIIFSFSCLFSLFFHKFMIVFQSNKNVIKNISPQYLRTVLFLIWDIISLIINGKTLKVLYEEAKNDINKESLFKIIQIDKTLFDHDWVRERIRKAMYSGDKEFFQTLSKAIHDDPLKNRKIRIRELIVLTVFWESGLNMLTMKELLELFQKCKLALKDDEITFRKLVDRFKKTRPQLLSISHLFKK